MSKNTTTSRHTSRDKGDLMKIEARFATTPNVDEDLLAVLFAYRRELTDQELVELTQKIRPICRDAGGRCFFIRPVDPRRRSFLWAPSFAEAADGPGGIVRHSTIYTLHSFSYHGMFKPSVAEVLAMIPQHLLDKVIAFETIGPGNASDLNRQLAAINASFHVAVTHLYV